MLRAWSPRSKGVAEEFLAPSAGTSSVLVSVIVSSDSDDACVSDDARSVRAAGWEGLPVRGVPIPLGTSIVRTAARQ